LNTVSTIAVPPCQAACPIQTDVRGYVSAVASGEVDRAIAIIRQVNPFPSVCGRICTRPCESACRRAQVDEAISIAALKRFAADKTKERKPFQRPEHYYDEKVAVIGGGPAGLTAAHDLALLGYEVTVFDARNILGGMLNEVPGYRLPKDVLQEEVNCILSLGIKVNTGMFLGRDFTIEGLLENHQAVFLAIGSQRSLLPGCKGVELPGIIAAVDFLKKFSSGQQPLLGQSVVVIGGGHTAIDAARTSIRMGSREVTIIYRRSLDEMPAGRVDVKNAEEEGIKVRYLSAPVEFLGDGSVQKVRCIEMRLGEPDETGRRRPLPVEGSEFEIKADTVLLAIGYLPEAEVLKDSRLIVSRRGTVIVKDETGTTNLKGVFAGGDVVSGPSSLVEAIASGKKAAGAFHRYFRNLPGEEAKEVYALRPLDESVVKLISKSSRQEMPVLPIEKRVNSFAEVELGYNLEQALMEAQRCLNCGAGALVADNCAACLSCVRICPYGVPVPGKEKVEIDISQCQACGICASECPALAINLKIETREEGHAALKRVIDEAMQAATEVLIIGFYCQYKLPAGPPDGGDGVYWLGKLCTGRLDIFQLIYPFELGVDGVAVHMCKNDECHFRDGSKWLLARIEKAKKILDEIGMGSNRLKIVPEDLSDFRKELEAMGMNPVRKRSG